MLDTPRIAGRWRRRSLAGRLLAGATCSTPRRAKSPLAARALLNGLARSRPAHGRGRPARPCAAVRRPGQDLAPGRGAGQLGPRGGDLPDRRRRAGPSATMASCCTAPTAAPPGHAMLDGRRPAQLMVEYYKREAATRLRCRRGRRAGQGSRALRRPGRREPLPRRLLRERTTGFLVGAFGLIFRTTDGGATWEPLAAPHRRTRKACTSTPSRGRRRALHRRRAGPVLKLDRAGGRFVALELPYKGTLFGVVGNARGADRARPARQCAAQHRRRPQLADRARPACRSA